MSGSGDQPLAGRDQLAGLKLYMATSNAPNATEILTEIVPFTAVGAYVGTLYARAWMEFGNYRL